MIVGLLALAFLAASLGAAWLLGRVLLRGLELLLADRAAERQRAREAEAAAQEARAWATLAQRLEGLESELREGLAAGASAREELQEKLAPILMEREMLR